MVFSFDINRFLLSDLSRCTAETYLTGILVLSHLVIYEQAAAPESQICDVP